MKLEHIIFALVVSILLYFLSDYLFDKLNVKYYANIPVMRFEGGEK